MGQKEHNWYAPFSGIKFKKALDNPQYAWYSQNIIKFLKKVAIEKIHNNRKWA